MPLLPQPLHITCQTNMTTFTKDQKKGEGDKNILALSILLPLRERVHVICTNGLQKSEMLATSQLAYAVLYEANKNLTNDSQVSLVNAVALFQTFKNIYFLVAKTGLIKNYKLAK